MKIKSDFVTNSSSTAYVVFVPNAFKLNPVEAEEQYTAESYGDPDNIPYSPEILLEMEECIESLKTGGELWFYGDEGTPQNVYYAVLNLCESHKLIMNSMEVGSEGGNTIMAITEERVKEVLFNHIDMDKMFKTVAKGEELCCEVKKDSP